MCVCMSACACVRERERRGEGNWEGGEYKPVRRAEYVALLGMIAQSCHRQDHLRHNTHIALLVSQHRIDRVELVDSISQALARAV